jgi:hypothetical protein
MIDNGKLSTILITIAVPILGILISNPTIVENLLGQYGLAIYTPILISILIAAYNYYNPRPQPEEEA